MKDVKKIYIKLFIVPLLIIIGFSYLSLTIYSYSQTELEKANFIASKGIIENYSSNPANYRLGDTITRKETMKIIMKLSGLDVNNECEGKFGDVSNDWGCKYIETALNNSYITDNYYFRPNDNITKIETLKLIIKAKGIQRIHETNNWQNDYMETAYKYGIIDKKYYDYDTNATRGWIFYAIANAENIDENNTANVNTPINTNPCLDWICDTLQKDELLSRTTEITIPDASRPEIIYANDKVYVVYLNDNNEFMLKIFNSDLSKELSSKTLMKSPNYGSLRDVRITNYKSYVYIFYQIEKNNDPEHMTELWGIKYSLGEDNLQLISSSKIIQSAKEMGSASSGDELVDDPMPLIINDSIYVITRYKGYLNQPSNTKFHVYEFNKDFKKQTDFDIDLSEYIDGEPQQSSTYYSGGNIYIATTTLNGSYNQNIAFFAPLDVVVIKLDSKWKYVSQKIISTDQNPETFVTGFAVSNNQFYVGYGNYNHTPNPFSKQNLLLNILDSNLNSKLIETVDTIDGLKDPRWHEVRPSIAISEQNIYYAYQVKADPRESKLVMYLLK